MLNNTSNHDFRVAALFIRRVWGVFLLFFFFGDERTGSFFAMLWQIVEEGK
jgi:hypothetical protein